MREIAFDLSQSYTYYNLNDIEEKLSAPEIKTCYFFPG